MITIPYLARATGLAPENVETLVGLKAQVEDLWEHETGSLWLAREDYVQTTRLVSDAETLIELNLRNVTELSLVEETDPSDTDWEELTVDEDFRTAGKYLQRIGRPWRRLVRVTCTGGYTDEDAPRDIVYAMGVQVQFQLARHGSERVHVSSQNFEGGAGVFLVPDIHPAFAAAARRYGRHLI